MSNMDHRVNTAEAYIEEHFAQAMTVCDIAAAASVSTATLTTLFKKHFDMTVTQYVAAVRLEQAAQLLCSTTLPIKEIAAKCGFKTVPHFSRLFKEKYAMPPAQYRTADNRERTPPILDVVFEQPTKNQMEYINPGLLEHIVAIGFTLAQGPIRKLDGEERYAFIDRTIPKEAAHSMFSFEKKYFDSLEELRLHASHGYPVRIWCALAHAEPLCEFAYLCNVLSEYDCPVYVINHPNERAEFFGAHNGDFSPFLELTTPLSRKELEAQAALWRRLVEENAPLRVRENGTLRSAPIDFYDERLGPWLPTEWGGIVCVENIAAQPLAYGDRDIDPGWYEFRLHTMIDDGVFSVVPIIGTTERTFIRHAKSTAPITTEDLLRIAWSCHPHLFFERPSHLPMPQVWALLASSGRVYSVINDDTETLLTLLKENGDTQIAKWITLWSTPTDILPPVDVPSMQARKALLELDESNADTVLVLRGTNQLIEKTLGETMP